MGTLRAIRLLVVTSVRVAPGQSALCLCETAGVFLNMLVPLYLAWFVTGAIEHDTGRVATAVVAFVVQVGIVRVLNIIGMTARAGQLERVGYAFDTRIAEITAGIAHIEHFDDPKYLDQLQILQEERGALGLSVNMLLNALNSFVGTAGTIALALTADWRMVLVAVASVPGMLFASVLARWQARAEREGAPFGRLVTHLLQLGTQPGASGELRVFGLTDGLRTRLAEAARRWRAPRLRVAYRETLVTALSQLLFYGTAAAVLAWLVHEVRVGRVGIGALTLALLLIGRLQGISSDIRADIGNLAGMSRTAGRFLWLLDSADELAARHTGTAPPPGSVRHGIEMESVSYRYPGAKNAALQDVSLSLPVGTVVAFVGENGSGKSTLVNLLTGLILPTAGSVRLDGRDVRELDLHGFRERLAGAFQDHVRFEFTVRDCVAVGDLAVRTDEAVVLQAVHDGAADAVLRSVPSGLSTQLGATWPGGVDLSGGQWQRLAIARGMMRRAPVLRVLDEPTAALDAATEHELFDRYAAAARAGRESGTITVLVTHRFSTVAAADLVVVLDRGRVVEQGTHAELIRRQGQYAQLYRIQAAGYA